MRKIIKYAGKIKKREENIINCIAYLKSGTRISSKNKNIKQKK